MDDVKVYSLASEGVYQITPHFKVREFRCKDGTDPVFISSKLVNILEKIRTKYGAAVTINSGYRTVAHNAATEGSSSKSQHCMGLAADIVVAGHSPAEVAAYAETLLPGTGGIGVYKSFTHIDVRQKKSRWKG